MRTQLLRPFTVGALILGFGCNRDATAPQLTPSPLLRAESAAVPTLERFYGPERFTRTHGAPDEFTRHISTLRFEAPFVLHVRVGAPAGSRRPFAGVLALDGTVLLSESDFVRQAEWAIPVTPGAAAVLAVTLRGAPDSFIEVWLEGKRSDPVFCPGGRPGTYATLPEAIADAAIGGTVLVCDGEHVLDLVRIRKPVTLRSQNPGGATIADADPSLVPQAGRPALVIDSVPAGLVRLVDLNFLVRGRGVFAGGHFDQVVLDSVRFTGRGLTVPYGVWIDRSSVVSARVDVTRSRFASMAIGVFPVADVETNVTWSTFDNFGGGAVTYSGRPGSPAPSVSFGRTEHNTFTNCGLNGCIRVVGPPGPREVVIARNTMTRASGPTQNAVIVVSRTSPDLALPRAPVIIEHNSSTGAVLGNGPSSHQQEWWSVGSFVSNLGGPSGNPVVVRSNSVTDHYVGISASAPVKAHDNHFVSGHRAIMQFNSAVAIDFQRNDVYFEMSIWRAAAGGNAGNYRCNWWGSASGPPFPSNAAADSYTPWATAPIAGTSVPCDGTGAPIPPPSVVRVCSAGLAGGPLTFPTVPAAYTAVATGGTILICDGTHVVQDVRIDKAITIRGEGPGKPMLDAQGVRSNFDIRNVAGGAVVIRGLQFRGTWLSTDESPRPGYGANINIEGDYSTITVEDSDFHPSGQLVAYDMPAPGQPRLSYNSGIWFWNTVGNGITVRANTFSGGDIGVGGVGAKLVVRSNSFRGQSNAAVHSGAGTTLVEDNDISDCGTAWCIAAFSVQPASLTVARNRITVGSPRRTSRAILADNRDVTIAGNVITGVGGTRVDRSSYPIMYAIAAHASRTAATTNYRIDGNTISGAYSGIDFASVTAFGTDGPVIGDANDNRISDVATPFSGSGGAGLLTVKLHRNDFSAYVGTDRDGQGTAFKSVELSCNWWGSASGPTGYLPPSWVPLVAPVATEPIAGRPDVSCP